MVAPRAGAALALLLLPAWLGANCGRERLLPAPEPMEIHRDSGLSDREQRRLADVRRFVGPYEQSLLEETLRNLDADPRVPPDELDAALSRALSGFSTVDRFCPRLEAELASLQMRGPEAAAPAAVATAVPIETAFGWISDAGRARYPEARDLARAIRDGELAAGSFRGDVSLGRPGAPLFVTDAAVFDGPGPSAARRLCHEGGVSPSWVVLVFPVEALPAPLRVPTAADAICRPKFVPAAPEARTGTNCAGNPEFVTSRLPLAAAAELRLSR